LDETAPSTAESWNVTKLSVDDDGEKDLSTVSFAFSLFCFLQVMKDGVVIVAWCFNKTWCYLVYVSS
jgi:hypothetical protein